MKKLFIFFLFLLTIQIVEAQSVPPQYFNYQAVIRNNRNELLPNQKVQIEFKISKFQSPFLTEVYKETQIKVSNAVGIIEMQVGKGTRSTVLDFSSINWSDSLVYDVVIRNGNNLSETFAATTLPESFASNPYSILARRALKADTALVAKALAEAGNDINGKFVGSVQIFGMNEGAAYVRGKEWKRVTKTIYDHISRLFGSNGSMNNTFNNLKAGMRREYYLVIRKADDVNDCAGAESLGRKAMGSEWRFYLTWQNKAGHKFQLGRNWGALADGSMDWVKIPAMESYPDFKHPMYWHLEARMNPNCPASAMQVFSVHVVAYDIPLSQTTDTVTMNIDLDNNVGAGVDYTIGNNIRGAVSVEAGTLRNQGSDFQLGTNDGRSIGNIPHQRALVHDGNDVLVLNYNGDFEGGVRVDSDLELRGADIIENAHNTEGVQAGEVLVIDSTLPNHVKRSQKAYDKTVVGVVSGAGGIKHGMELKQEGMLDGNTNFAIAGRVYVKVTGKVIEGDLLTTSDKAGFAMTAKNRKKREGAVIGKALTKPNAEGLVLMLVMMR